MPIEMEEAKTLWCPFARTRSGENRTPDGKPLSSCKCIHEACMAWVSDGPSWAIDGEQTTEGHCELIHRTYHD